MSAVNYGYNELLGHYVFLRAGEAPKVDWLSGEWVWWEPPQPWVRKIGESGKQGCLRSDHLTRSCSTCRAKAPRKYDFGRAAP